MDMSSELGHLPPLALVGAAFLAGMDMLGREQRRSRSASAPAASDAIRWTIAGLLLTAALAHVPLIPEHLEEAFYMGNLFVGFSISAFGVATALALRPSRFWYAAATALCAAALGAYVATRLVAFPQLADDVGVWAEPLGLASIAAETAVVVLGLVALRRSAASTHRTGVASAG